MKLRFNCHTKRIPKKEMGFFVVESLLLWLSSSKWLTVLYLTIVTNYDLTVKQDRVSGCLRTNDVLKARRVNQVARFSHLMLCKN